MSPKVDRKTKVDILLSRIRTEEAMLPSMLTLPEDMLLKDAIQRCKNRILLLWQNETITLHIHPSIYAIQIFTRPTTTILFFLVSVMHVANLLL